MPNEKRIERGEIHPKYWEKTVKEAFKNDPPRIIIELIKNSADSYTRLHKKGKIEPPFEIFVTIFCKKRSPPDIEVLDYAEGMNSKKLKEALKYGTQTSMGEDIEAVTSAEKGIGLKDALMALKDNWLITVNDGIINERKIHPDFKIGFGKENEKITEEERKKIKIPKNGTSIKGTLPSYFSERKFSTICKKLQKHFLLRKLLQDPDYKIYVIDGQTEEKVLLRYIPPQIDKIMLEQSFEIDYNGKKYKIHLTVNKSKKEYDQRKPYGEAGLLFFYGKYSVVDFTFGRFDGDLSFSKFFGEVRMEIEKIIRDPEEAPIVDEKRKGLDPEHPFNRKLFGEINKQLEKIREDDDTSKYSFDEHTKREILKEINKIYKDVKGRGPPPEPPIRPQYFEFYPVYTSLEEYEPKRISLIINSSIISDTLSILLKSNNPNIILKKDKIEISQDKIKEEFIIKQIEIYSERAGSQGEIVATSPEIEHSARMGVEVLENPMFSPKDGFAFVPDKTTIVNGGEKKVILCIDRDVIGNSQEITFFSEGPINCPNKLFIPARKNINERPIKNILKIEIPIKVKGGDHVGEKSIIRASYIDKQYLHKQSDLHVTIVPEPSFGGPLRDVRPSGKSQKKISSFIESEGVIELYYKHPLIKKYMKKDFRSKRDFLVFVADTITREAIKAMVYAGIKENSSRFYIFDTDHPEIEIEDHIIREYYEQGPKLHELFIKLARTFKLGEEEF